MQQPIHGGRLNAAANKFQIPLEKWIDLSTGINPNGWPVPILPSHIFQRLPEENDQLNTAAQHYYQADNFIAVSGSQVAIQLLPKIRSHSHITVVNPGYQEHAHCWRSEGHDVTLISPEHIDLQSTDVLVIINPNNPTGQRYRISQLLEWHSILERKNGWLIVDEAFIDGEEDQSLVKFSYLKGLIILRSIGKFFGLAGLRVGFVFAEKTILNELTHQQGLWAISTPSRYIATQALLDQPWQIETQKKLAHESERLANLMSQYDLKPSGGTQLFKWVCHSDAAHLYEQFAQQGILVRLFEDSPSLRFGLPKDEAAWQQLENVFIHL